VLVHHADPEGAGRSWRGDRARRPLYLHYTGIRPHEPVRYMHEGGLARSVLSQQRVQLAGHQREIGPAQCLHGAESPADAM
jgi:hypothetical protein